MPRPTRKMLLGAGAVVVIAALLGGGAFALTHSSGAAPAPAAASGPAPEGTPGHGKHAGRAGRAKAAKGAAAGLLARVQHGEFVTTGATGETATLEVQRGVITAVDPASVTLRSSDGFTATYAITPTTVVAPMRGRHGPASGTAAGAPAADAPAGDPAAVPGTDPTSVPAGGVASLQPNQSVMLQGAKSPTGVTATRITPIKAAA